MKSILISSVILCCSVFLVNTPLSAPQPGSPGSEASFLRGTKLYSGIHMEFWNYAQLQTVETVVPVYYSMNLDQYLEGVAVDLVTSPTYGTLIGNDISDNLFGLAGTKARVSYNFNNAILGTFGIQAPTGTNKLSQQQTNTVGALSTKQMNFKVSRYGTGLDLDLTFSTSWELMDDFIIGAAMGILTHGAFNPVDNSQEYNPGNEMSAILGADYTMYTGGKKLRLSGDLTYTHYTADEINNKGVFAAGDKYNLNVTGSTKLSPGYYNSTSLTFTFRTEEKVLAAASSNSPGNDLLFNNRLHLLKYKKYSPFIITRIYKYFADENGNGSAFTAGAGAGGYLALAPRMTLNAEAAMDMGVLNSSFLFGFEINGGVNYAF